MLEFFFVDGRARGIIVRDMVSGDIERHIRRDAIGGLKPRERLFDRYYLLVWDEPRTKKNTLLRALTFAARSTTP